VGKERVLNLEGACTYIDHGTLNMLQGRRLHGGATKAGYTLSSRQVSSFDVTREVEMWKAIWHWILWHRFTLLSLCLRHVISRGALVGSCASTPIIFLLSHTFRETWPSMPCSEAFASNEPNESSAHPLNPVVLRSNVTVLPSMRSLSFRHVYQTFIFVSSRRATYPAHQMRVDLIILVTFREEHLTNYKNPHGRSLLHSMLLPPSKLKLSPSATYSPTHTVLLSFLLLLLFFFFFFFNRHYNP
jgi:hypothetical protein